MIEVRNTFYVKVRYGENLAKVETYHVLAEHVSQAEVIIDEWFFEHMHCSEWEIESVSKNVEILTKAEDD